MARLDIAPSVQFSQAVWFNGAGTVILGDYVGVGYAYSVGGAITLQARYPGSVIRIGKGTQLANGVEIIAQKSVSIGENCRIGKCLIIDGDFHGVENHASPGKVEPVEIGDDVFIGDNVIILKGVTIGSGATVGAGSVVTRDVPQKKVVAGNPARLIR